MGDQKNLIINSTLSTDGGDLINGDNNFILKIIFNKITVGANIEKAVEQTRNILNKIQSDISGVVLKRDLAGISIEDLFDSGKIIFIDGEAGTGKSVFAKYILETLNDTCILSFAGDQLLKSSLSSTLKECNIDVGIKDVFAEFAEFPKKLIYVDSFEKLLEGDADAFRELLYVLKEDPDIRLLLTCRSYAAEILKLNYFDAEQLSSFHTIHVPRLNDEELDFFAKEIPALKSVVNNDNLRTLLRIPKYLSLANKLLLLSSNDYSKIGKIEFKNKLWRNIVGGQNEERRCNTFIKVVVKRAKNLTLLTTVQEFDLDIIRELKSDGILFEENQLFAPSHDIFEDWGLIKFIDALYIDSPNILEFYKKLTNQPAIRRGFRLWIESKIDESSSWIYDFITDTTNSKLVENYWKDEIITSVLKSDVCAKYFQQNEVDLLENDAKLLQRFMHLLKISCKDSNQIPNSVGWDVTIKFLYEKHSDLFPIEIQIIRFILDWSSILNSSNINKDTARAAGLLLYDIIEKDNGKSESINLGGAGSLKDDIIKFLFRSTEYIPDRVKILLDNLIAKASKKDLSIKHKEMMYALSYLNSGTLPQFFPDELISLADLTWKQVDSGYSTVKVNGHFGLIDRFDYSYFPHSAYQTFVLKVLHSHPLKALDFIIDLTNYCADKYISSGFLRKNRFFSAEDDVCNVEFIYEEKIYKIKGSTYLWTICRGGRITIPYLLQSVVVALEKYLLELGNNDSEVIEKILEIFFDKIFKGANNVILISVLSSITMAYPEKIGDKFLPLLSCRLFFDWDRQRWLNDYSKSSFLGFFGTDPEGELYDNERHQSLQLVHRTKYNRGLSGFILEYQLVYRKLNEKVFEMIDFLKKSNVGDDDLYFLKLLTEIDLRKQKIETIEYEGSEAIQIAPDYSSDHFLEQEMNKNEDDQKILNEVSKHHLWICETYKEPNGNREGYDFWKKSLGFYEKKNQNYLQDDYFKINIFPVGTLAAIGLGIFFTELDDFEFAFCVDTILNFAEDFYEEKKKEKDFSLDILLPKISVFDYDSVYETLPKLLFYASKMTEQQFDRTKYLIFSYLRDNYVKEEHHMKKFYDSFKKYVWDSHYQFAYNCFMAMIKYAEFFNIYGRDTKFSEYDLPEILEEEKTILNFIETNEGKEEVPNLSYTKYNALDLEKAMLIFPVERNYEFSFQFINHIFYAHYDIYLNDDDIYELYKYSEIETVVRHTVVCYLLKNFSEESSKLFQKIIALDPKETGFRGSKFIKQLVEDFYYIIDKHSSDMIMVGNFWRYWNQFYVTIKDRPHYLNQQFVFYSRWWQHKADDWTILKYKGATNNFFKMLSNMTFINVEACLQLLSGIGFTGLMPNSIGILNRHLIDGSIEILEGDNYYYGNKLVMKMFREKLKVIKENKKIMSEFLIFLDIMIASGSSKAYYVRENLILYKKC